MHFGGQFPAKSRPKEGRYALKRKRFSVEQIVAVLKQAEVGVPAVEVCRQVGITEQTFYRWKKVLGLAERPGSPAKATSRGERQAEKARRGTSLDKAMLQDVVSKKF